MNGAVITALNEVATIGPLVKSLHDLGYEVCVVDDGSNDGTGQVAMSYGAHIIRHNTPRGIGTSLQEAWNYAIQSNWDYTIQIDAGGSHDPQEALALRSDKYDIVIGSRFLKNSEYIGGKRQHFSRLYAKLCNFAIGGYVVSDWTSGYRCFSRRAMLELIKGPPYWTNGHAWQAEVIHRAVRRRLSVAEAPITYRAGRSSMKAGHIWDAFLVLNKVMFL